MRRLPKLLALWCIVLAAHAEQRPRCSPIAGSEMLWARPGLRFLLVGEMHGTTEMPAIFTDLVCAARAAKRPIVVGLELRDQHALGRFIDFGARDLLATSEWTNPDGRTSTAMLELLEDLRVLKREGVVSGVVAFSATRAGNSAGDWEERMASALLRAAARDALVVALAGNLHACKARLPEIPYPLMASLLPPAATISLLAVDRGGEAWNCQSGTCGPHKVSGSGGTTRGIAFGGSSAIPGYDGILSTGRYATASTPAAGKPTGSTPAAKP